MGQRHQIFVIARAGSRYRPLAAVHHQFLFGQRAVIRLRQLLKIFSDPANTSRLHDELEEARRKANDEGFWAPIDWNNESRPENSARFPFITTCLLVGASFDLLHGCSENARPCAFNTNWNGGDNSDGMTVIDITNLPNPRYCFLADDSCECRLPVSKPISAVDYLTAYVVCEAEENEENGEDEWNKTLPVPPELSVAQKELTSFEQYQLIDHDAIDSAWLGMLAEGFRVKSG